RHAPRYRELRTEKRKNGAGGISAAAASVWTRSAAEQPALFGGAVTRAGGHPVQSGGEDGSHVADAERVCRAGGFGQEADVRGTWNCLPGAVCGSIDCLRFEPGLHCPRRTRTGSRAAIGTL